MSQKPWSHPPGTEFAVQRPGDEAADRRLRERVLANLAKDKARSAARAPARRAISPVLHAKVELAMVRRYGPERRADEPPDHDLAEVGDLLIRLGKALKQYGHDEAASARIVLAFKAAGADLDIIVPAFTVLAGELE